MGCMCIGVEKDWVMPKLHAIPKDVSNGHEEGLKGEDIRIIHNNVPCLDIMYAEEVRGITTV